MAITYYAGNRWTGTSTDRGNINTSNINTTASFNSINPFVVNTFVVVKIGLGTIVIDSYFNPFILIFFEIKIKKILF